MNDVYLITNRIDGKRYVGVSSRGYIQRFREHVWDSLGGSNTLLHAAIREFGPDNFDIQLLESNISDELISMKERYYVRAYDTFYIHGKGYNMTEGGTGVCGYHHSAETKQILSTRFNGRSYPPEHGIKISNALRGMPKSDEHRAALSRARMGRFCGSENPFFGKHHSEHTKTLVSIANSKHSILRISDSGDVLETYLNLNCAGRWVVANALSAAKYDTCANRINEVCRSKNRQCKAYGFHWAYGEG